MPENLIEVTLRLTPSNLFMLRTVLQDKIDDANQLLDKTGPHDYPNLRKAVARQAIRCQGILDQLPDQVNGWYLLPWDENGDPII